ncbi:serine hydrolase [Roseibium salinum]|nr:serine hydrolase [Roseibium salinum]
MRLLTISGFAAAVICAGLAAAYSNGLMQLILAGYPPAVWPASGSFEIVAGAPQPHAARAPGTRLDRRGRELFANSGSRALLAMRGGQLLLETYADGIGPGTRLNSYSLVKSLVGALVLKAVSEGKITSLEDPVGSYLAGFGPEVFFGGGRSAVSWKCAAGWSSRKTERTSRTVSPPTIHSVIWPGCMQAVFRRWRGNWPFCRRTGMVFFLSECQHGGARQAAVGGLPPTSPRHSCAEDLAAGGRRGSLLASPWRGK